MNKLLKKILVATTVIVVAFTAGIFSACSYGLDQEQKKKKEGYTCTVTYDANGGTYGSNSSVTYALVKENSLVPAPGYVDGNTQASVKVPTRRNYQLINETKAANDDEKNAAAIKSKSWFQAVTDENGKVVYEGEGENKTPVLVTGEPWNFAKDKVTEDITLVAKWTKVYRFILCLTEEVVGEDGQVTVQEKEVRSYTVNPGATMGDKLYNKQSDDSIVRRADFIRPSVSGYTLLDFYADEDLTTQFALDYQHPGTYTKEVTVIDPETNQETTETIETNDVKIYVKYLKGRYDLISQENVKALTGASQWYLVEDVDLTSETAWTALNNFTGTIYGNGFTMRNMTVVSYAKNAQGGGFNKHSIFGKMNGLIENITFENVNLKVDTQYGATGIIGEQRLSYFAYDFGTNGLLNNVTLKDCAILRKADNYYTATIGDSSMWYVAPATEKAIVTVVETGVTPNPTAVKIVTE